MDVTVCDEQVVALAASVNGEETDAPLAGLVMVTAEAVEAGGDAGAVTEKDTLAVQVAPLLP